MNVNNPNENGVNITSFELRPRPEIGLYVWQLFLIVMAASFFLFLISKICFLGIRRRIETRSRHLMERTHMDQMERGFFFSFLADPGIPGSGQSPTLRHNMFPNIIRLPNQPQREEPCTICLESLQRNTVVLPCGHMFHSSCIRRWLLVKTQCPLCALSVFTVAERHPAAEETADTAQPEWHPHAPTSRGPVHMSNTSLHELNQISSEEALNSSEEELSHIDGGDALSAWGEGDSSQRRHLQIHRARAQILAELDQMAAVTCPGPPHNDSESGNAAEADMSSPRIAVLNPQDGRNTASPTGSLQASPREADVCIEEIIMRAERLLNSIR